jgi:hypothetical protein
MSTVAVPEVHLKPVVQGLWSSRTRVATAWGYEHGGIAIETVTVPPFAVIVEPGGRGGSPAFSVTLTFGALDAPPVYVTLVTHPVW